MFPSAWPLKSVHMKSGDSMAMKSLLLLHRICVFLAVLDWGSIKAGAFMTKIPLHNKRLPKKLGCCEMDHSPTLQNLLGLDCLKAHFW